MEESEASSARQLSEAVKAATAPFQYAVSTQAGCECVAHALQSMCEANPHTTALSTDGIGAFDLVSRTAMLRGLRRVPDGPEALPFVRMFYGQASVYFWEDDEGIVHDIHQAEGGEQGDALMPLLFSLGQHPALQAVQAQLLPGERVFAYLDDVYVTTTPTRHLPFVRTRIVDPCQHPGPWGRRPECGTVVSTAQQLATSWNASDVR